MKRLAATLALFAAQQVWACCGVGPNGMPIQFRGQQDIVIFDHKTQTEYFVRSAEFQSNRKGLQFGFVAPSPSMPELSEVNWDAFYTLRDLRPMGPSCSAQDASAAPAAETKAAVEVLQDVQVGQFRAQTLRSEDANALATYLKENKFVASADIVEWVKFYTDKKWLLTAFKVNPVSAEANSYMYRFEPIMMKFKTDKPFFPYLVPASNRTDEATLDLYVVGASRANHTAGAVNPEGDVWDASIPNEKLQALTASLKLPPGTLDGLNHVTSYEKLPFAIKTKDDGYVTFEPTWLGPAKSAGRIALSLAVLWGLTRFVLRGRKRSA